MVSAIQDPFSLAQIVGYVATVIGVIGFSQHDDSKMRLYVFVMGLTLVVHFFLLGAFTATLAAFLAASRVGLSMIPRLRQNPHPIAISYVLMTVLMGLYLYERPLDIFPLFASMMGIYGFFYCEGIRMRVILFFGGGFWLTHNVLAMSYGPSVMEVFILVSNARTIMAMKKGAKKPPLTESL